MLTPSPGLRVRPLSECLTKVSVQVPVHLPLLCKWAQAVPYHQAAVLGLRAPGMCTPALAGVRIALPALADTCARHMVLG